jgi:Arc/MetJ family transcription regulator
MCSRRARGEIGRRVGAARAFVTRGYYRTAGKLSCSATPVKSSLPVVGEFGSRAALRAAIDPPVASTRTHQEGILMHMRTTLILNDTLLEKARNLTGLKEKTAMVHAGLEALIARESARRLAALGGSEKTLRPPRRRRPAPARRRGAGR